MSQLSSSVAIELLRTGSSGGNTLKEDTRYIALLGSDPQVEFSVPIDQRTFADLVEQLRYEPNNEAAVRLGRQQLEKVVRGIFSTVSFVNNQTSPIPWLHLRLVVAPKELGLLPFEFSLTPANLPGAGDKPFFANPLRLTTLTREIRQSAGREFQWPTTPRVLFAWAQPLKPVPHQAHVDKLVAALAPWVRPLKDNAEPIPNLAPRFTELREASVAAIRDEIGRSSNNPYTHVHILAHGTKVPDRDGSRFALAMHRADGQSGADAVDGWALASALTHVDEATTQVPAVVVVSACDGGNEGSPLVPGASLAHALHTSGMPYVLASQFPLTEEGSVTMAAELYPRLFSGEDPRAALYFVRQKLQLDHPNTHDWGSLVAYARFPEDLDQQLEWVRLKLLLARLKSAHAWVDHVLRHQQKIEQTFGDVEDRLNTAIETLETILKKGVAAGGDNPKVRNENLGLLGSAYKRKAEHLYRRGVLTKQTEAHFQRSREALKSACRRYLQGHDALLSDHWVGCQYLSLTAVMIATLVNERDRWTVVHFAAQQALKDSDKKKYRLWPLGTLCELYLLQPLTVANKEIDAVWETATTTARTYLTQFFEIATEEGETEEIESTARQLDRYVSWWAQAFPSASSERLKSAAQKVQSILPSLDEL